MTRFSLAKSFFMLSVIPAALLLLLLLGCRGGSAASSAYGEESYEPKYSSGFSIYSAGNTDNNAHTAIGAVTGNTVGTIADDSAGTIVDDSAGTVADDSAGAVADNIASGAVGNAAGFAADDSADTVADNITGSAADNITGDVAANSADDAADDAADNDIDESVGKKTGGASSVLVIRNPWQGAEGVAMEVFLSRGGEKAPEGFGGTVVQVPLRRVVCLSSSHAAFIDALGLSDAIVGVSGAKYISNEQLRGRYERGELADVGYDTNLNYELLASLKPDIVFIYGISGQNTALEDKLRELGISSLYIGEYVEETALGKAEWIVPFGELMGRRAEAESIFGRLAARYEELKEMVQKADDKPSVMLNSPYRDVWFVPGGKSYMAALIGDAGGEYLFAGNDSAVSMPLSGEAAYVAVSGADIWLNPSQARTISELAAQNPKFVDIPAVRQRQVYNATKRSTHGGGSDFWESGAVRADRVLEDLIMIIHPELIPDGELYYFERLD